MECWSARELQSIFGYTKWVNFLKVIDKAKTSCESSGVIMSDHFADVGKMVPIGSDTERRIEDIALSRYERSVDDKGFAIIRSKQHH